jgi:hypothetical protein
MQPARLVRARARWVAGALLFSAGLGACHADLPDHVFVCTAAGDCPTGMTCDTTRLLCQRTTELTANVSQAGRDAGRAGTGDEDAATATDAGRPLHEQSTAGSGASDAGALDSGQRIAPSGGAGAAATGSGGAGHAGEAAGATAVAGSGGIASGPTAGVGGQTAAGSSAGSAASSGGRAPGGAVQPCPDHGYCYDFEAGVLDPNASNQPWPNPVGSNDGLPTNGQLSTLESPPSSGNHVLVSHPSSKDGWPKATVGYTFRDPFSVLEVSFDFAADAKLVDALLPVVVFEFTADMQSISDNSAGFAVLTLDASDVLVELAKQPSQADSTDRLAAEAPASSMTHVSLVFDRRKTPCSVTAKYGGSPAKTVPMACDLGAYNVEFGLNVDLPTGQHYSADYVGYYDNFTIIQTL